jgi:hypothetical protein
MRMRIACTSGLVQHKIAQLLVFLWRQHIAMRERQAVDRIVRDVVPVDQLLHHIFIGAKRQHMGNHLHGFLQVGGHPLPLARQGDGLAGVRLELHLRRRRCIHGNLQGADKGQEGERCKRQNFRQE